MVTIVGMRRRRHDSIVASSLGIPSRLLDDGKVSVAAFETWLMRLSALRSPNPESQEDQRELDGVLSSSRASIAGTPGMRKILFIHSGV